MCEALALVHLPRNVSFYSLFPRSIFLPNVLVEGRYISNVEPHILGLFIFFSPLGWICLVLLLSSHLPFDLSQLALDWKLK